MPEPVRMPDPSQIRDAAEMVLASPGYSLNLYEPPYFDQLRDGVRWLNELIAPLWSFGEDLYKASPVLFWIFTAILLLIVFALIGHIIYSFRAAFARRQIKEYQAAQSEPALDPAHWEKRAETAARKEDFILALRLLFRAGLLRLEGGKVRPAATNREYVRRYRTTPAEEPLRELVNLIDYKWYGGRSCVYDDWQTGKEAYEAICVYVEERSAAQLAESARRRRISSRMGTAGLNMRT